MIQKSGFSSTVILVLANMVPLVGVLFLGWDGKSVFVIYILETIMIGILNVLKMLTVYILNGSRNELKNASPNAVNGWGLIPFFIFHYNFFIFVQSVLFFAFSSIWQSSATEPYHLLANFAPYITGETKYALISLLVANLSYLVEDFILSGKYRTESMGGLMFQPYKRIILQQLVVILGGFIFMLSGSAVAVAVLFVLLKTVADYIAANAATNPKLKQWVLHPATENGEKQLTDEQKQMVEKMFDGK